MLWGSLVVIQKIHSFSKGICPLFEGHRGFIARAFFVHKKQGRQRLFVDAGETNRHFKRPPSVAGQPGSLGWVGMQGRRSLLDLHCYVRDSFHRMALPDDLSDCFALPGGTAREFGVHDLDGKPLGGDDHLWPCCWCLPMGFGWAVYLAQQATSVAVVEATGIAESELFHDRQVNLRLEHGPGAFCRYRPHRAHWGGARGS